jgi:hypothetical protein
MVKQIGAGFVEDIMFRPSSNTRASSPPLVKGDLGGFVNFPIRLPLLLDNAGD